MKKAASFILTALAAAGMATSSPALAQDGDLDPAAVEAAARYALPYAFNAFVVRCGDELYGSTYALNNSDRLYAKFIEGNDEHWPLAKEALIQIVEGDGEESLGPIFEVMGDAELRPFVNSLIGNLVAQEIKTDDCLAVERGLEILDPLPADNVAQLIGFLVEMGQRGDDEEDNGEEEIAE